MYVFPAVHAPRWYARYQLTCDICQYSMYGHIRTMAESVMKGVQKAGGTADLFQFVDRQMAPFAK